MIDASPGIHAAQTDLSTALREPRSAWWVNVVGRAKTLAPALRKLKFLRVLNVCEGSVREVPDWVAELKSLRALHLDDNRIRTLPASIGRMPKLQWLGLTKNELESLPGELGLLTSLDSLWLADNPRLKTLPNSLFALQRLRRLDLANTGITELPEAAKNLVGLHELRLEKTPLFNNRKARDAVKALFPKSKWSGGTLEIARPRTKAPAALTLTRAAALKAIRAGTLPDRALVKHLDVSKGDFSFAYLKGQHLDGANLRQSRWRNCALSVSLNGADLEGATFEDCVIEGDFERLAWRKINARRATFRRCVFVNVDFDRGDFREAHVELAPEDYGPAFSRIDGRGMTFINDAEVTGLNFERANLTDARLRGTFEGPDFTRARLCGADLREARFPFGDFEEADFTAARVGPHTLDDAETESARGLTPNAKVPKKKPKPHAKTRDSNGQSLGVTWVGQLSSEGGPFMFASLSEVATWGGADVRQGEREDDYSRMCGRLRGAALVQANRLFWQVDPGTFQVGVDHARTNVLLAVEADHGGPTAPAAPKAGKLRGSIDLDDGRLTLVWSPTPGVDIFTAAKKWPSGANVARLAPSNWGLGLELPRGKYRVYSGDYEGHPWCRIVKA